MLDEFSAAKINDKGKPSSAAVPTSSTSTADTSHAPTAEDANAEAEFERQLQTGMQELLGQFGSSPEMQEELQKMMRDLGDAATKEGASGATNQPGSGVETRPTEDAAAKGQKASETTFQDTIRKTMERMQTSGDAASAAAQTADENDILAQMMKEMESGNFPGLEGAGEEDFNKMLMGMMEQLTNKEILYEPMKELHDKYPAWMETNKDKVTGTDMNRYKEQQSLVADIVGRFESHGYSDDNKQDRDYIVEKMQQVSSTGDCKASQHAKAEQMQAAGSPPPDLVGDMGAAQEMLSDVDGGCPQQ